MNLRLERKIYSPESIIGMLYIDEKLECFTLEDVEREVKVRGKTAIPRGFYKVIIDWSNRFKRWMPHVLDVPGFEGIRIHSGNTAADTEGCILVGTTKAKNMVLQSRIAFDRLFFKLDKAHDIGEPIFLEIVKADPDV